MNNKIIIQVTSGRGPAECCWVVAQVVKTILMEAEANEIDAEVIYRNPGNEEGTLVSAIIRLKGNNVPLFAKQWIGTVLWVGQSLYRKFHKRRNWYVGVNLLEKSQSAEWNEKDLEFQTLRSSGPGGQHVNKTETAVRAIHPPSGLCVTASDSRSQIQNKKLAIERLYAKWLDWRLKEISKNEQSQWNQHNLLERGNPVRVFRASMKDIFSTSVNESTLDESPMAYKPMDEIISRINDTVEIQSVLKPVYNYKAGN